MTKEAMNHAIDVLKDSQDYKMGRAMTVEAVEFLEEALAKQEHGVPEVGFGNIKQEQGEPVAWGMEGKDGFIFDVICPAEHEREEGGYTTPLYTTPQPKQEHGEPVAKCCSAGIAHDCHAGDGCRIVERIKTAKTTPQQRKPLTDEQIFLCVPQDGDLRSFARAIEAAHGIKE